MCIHIHTMTCGYANTRSVKKFATITPGIDFFKAFQTGYCNAPEDTVDDDRRLPCETECRH